MQSIPFLSIILITLSGIAITYLLPIKLPLWARIFTGPAVGFITFTQCTLLISLTLNLKTTSAVIALFLTLLLGLIAVPKKRLSISFSLNLKKPLSHWPLLFVLTFIGSAVIYILGTKVLVLGPRGYLSGGGGLYGDTAMHSAFTTALVEHGLPPINLLNAGKPLIYPFMINLNAAALMLLGSTLRIGFIVPQIAYFIAFTVLFYLVAKKLTNKRASFLSMNIFFLGWGLGFVHYFQKVITTRSFYITKEYTNGLPGLHMHNVITGILLPARSFLPGLVIGMLITILFVFNDKKSQHSIFFYTFIGLLLGILPLWHTHTFLIFGFVVLFWIIQLHLPMKNLLKQLPTFLTHTAISYMTALIFTVPVIFWFSQQLSTDSFIHFMPGWMSVGKETIIFWIINSGMFLPLAIYGAIKMKKHWLFFVPFLFLFTLTNLVSFQPWEWDNVKMFSLIFLFLSIPTGFVLDSWFRRHLVLKILGLVIFISLLLSGSLSLIHAVDQTTTIYDKSGIDLADWVRGNTPKDALFLADPWATHPIPGLAGRNLYIGYPGHLWVHGIEYYNREQHVKDIMLGDVDQLFSLEESVDYVVVENIKNEPFEKNRRLFKVYNNLQFSVYNVNP